MGINFKGIGGTIKKMEKESKYIQIMINMKETLRKEHEKEKV